MKLLQRQKLSAAGLQAAQLRRPVQTAAVEPVLKAAPPASQPSSYWDRYLSWEDRLGEPVLMPWDKAAYAREALERRAAV